MSFRGLAGLGMAMHGAAGPGRAGRCGAWHGELSGRVDSLAALLAKHGIGVTA